MDQRIKNEIRHGEVLKALDPGKVWSWKTPAGNKRLKRRAQLLASSITAEMSVLEVGCGAGFFTCEIAKTGAKITAVDISPDLLKLAYRQVKDKNVTFMVGDAHNLNFIDNYFDIIVGSSILHHLEVEQALKEFYRVLKPGGSICFTEPNMLNPQIFLERNVSVLREKMHNSPDETAFIRWRLKKQLAEHGFSDIRIVPFDFLHPLVSVNLIPAFERIGGFLERVPGVSEIAGSLYITAVKG
ncbi:MAG: hypothetical protein A2Z88_09925 [Omnitrophica WOR_2 bacterium GWA2_47_8]|nr:MAG: hypothetical protein A2Z88_09925 [Omnitrophica WOR_2 bacterium GWA2_47_8]